MGRSPSARTIWRQISLHRIFSTQKEHTQKKRPVVLEAKGRGRRGAGMADAKNGSRERRTRSRHGFGETCESCGPGGPAFRNLYSTSCRLSSSGVEAWGSGGLGKVGRPITPSNPTREPRVAATCEVQPASHEPFRCRVGRHWLTGHWCRRKWRPESVGGTAFDWVRAPIGCRSWTREIAKEISFKKSRRGTYV